MRIDHCWGCKKPMVWAYTPNNKKMPLNPTPHPGPDYRGTYVITELENGRVECRAYEPMFDTDVEPHMNHWAECPDRERFKK